MKTRALKVLAAGCFLLAAASLVADDTAKKDLDALNGAWKVESIVQDGEAAPADFLKQISFTIKDGKYAVKLQDKELETGTIKLDPSKTPKTIDFEITGGNDKGKTQVGIYELKDGTFQFAMAHPGEKDRPTEMKSTKENKAILSVLKREKK